MFCNGKERNNVIEKTIKKDLCINCGTCSLVCPVGAIEMKRNKYMELNPYINDKCTNCGVCSKYCPNNYEKMKENAQKIGALPKPQKFGLKNASYYVAWSKDKQQRLQSASGGTITQLATYLLESRKVDGVIHAQRLWGKIGDMHYGAALSKTIQEVKENASSAYQPIDFSKVLCCLEENKIYFVTGTPCVIRGLKKLFNEYKKFNNIKIITCALVCSHNASSLFADYFFECNKLSNSENWQVNFRHKDETMADANNYNSYFYTVERSLFKKNRFESEYTNLWRSYYFSMNACLYCSDFWGYEADISVKDAWGVWSKEDSLGKSIVIIRDKELEKDFLNSGVEKEILKPNEMIKNQKKTSYFKQACAKQKFTKSIFSRSNRRIGLLKRKIILKSSKFLYRNFGCKTTKILMFFIAKIANLTEKI